MKELAPISSDPGYAAANEKMERLCAALTAEQAVERALTDKLNTAAGEPTPQDAIDQAHRIASGEPFKSSSPDGLLGQLSDSREKQRALHAGIAAQRLANTHLAGELSAAACAAARSGHAAAVARVAAAARELEEASKAEVGVRESLERAGFSSTSLPPMFFSPAGWTHESVSGLKTFLRAADHYIRRHSGELDPTRKVSVYALVDLPQHGAKCGAFVSVPEDVANDLSANGDVDLTADPAKVPAAPPRPKVTGTPNRGWAGLVADLGELMR